MSGYRFLATLVFVSVFSSSFAISAGVVKDLYQASRIVTANGTPSELERAMSSGLQETLIRVSGYSNVINDSRIKDNFKNAREYLANFRYESSAETRTNVLGEVVRTKKLVMEFAPQRIEDLLTRTSKPVWDSSRPSVLTFLAVESGSRREMLSILDSHNLLDALKQESTKRGVIYELPAMDFIDELAISASEVWGLFSDSILTAAERYDNEYVLAGRVYQLGENSWAADWLLLSEQTNIRFQTTAPEQEVLLTKAVGLVAETMAERYAIVMRGRAKNQIRVALEGVATLEDYSKALNLLNSLTVIKNATVIQVDAEQVTYMLESFGNEQQLLDILSLNSEHFQRVNADEAELMLQWIP